MANPEFYTMQEVAERLRVSKTTVYRRVDHDEIPGAVYIGPKLIRIHAATFDAWLTESRA